MGDCLEHRRGIVTPSQWREEKKRVRNAEKWESQIYQVFPKTTISVHQGVSGGKGGNLKIHQTKLNATKQLKSRSKTDGWRPKKELDSILSDSQPSQEGRVRIPNPPTGGVKVSAKTFGYTPDNEGTWA